MSRPVIGVLITRAAQQAAPLADAFSAYGARVYLLPAIESIPRNLEPHHPAHDHSSAFDWIIFVSANAVRFGVYLCNSQPQAQTIAIGPATSAALKQAGVPSPLMPSAGFDSEALLKMPALTHIKGARILMVKGVGGRALLGHALRERGAHVTVADVYERQCAQPTPHVVASIEDHWQRGDISVVTVTSGDVLRCLHDILSPTGRHHLSQSPLLVGSARIGALAREQGLQGPLIIATRPDDVGLVAALNAWTAKHADG